MASLYMIDNVRVLYATARKEFASDAKDDASHGTTSWIINPEAADNEPQIYTYREKCDTIPDSAVKSNTDMDNLVKDGRRYRLVLAKSTESLTIANYNQNLKEALEDVADVLAGYSQISRDVDGTRKTVGHLSMDGIHSLDRVFCGSPSVDMQAYTYTPEETKSEDENADDGNSGEGCPAEEQGGDNE